MVPKELVIDKKPSFRLEPRITEPESNTSSHALTPRVFTGKSEAAVGSDEYDRMEPVATRKSMKCKARSKERRMKQEHTGDVPLSIVNLSELMRNFDK